MCLLIISLTFGPRGFNSTENITEVVGVIVSLYSNRIYVFIYVFIYNIGLVLLGNINFINLFKEDLGFVQEIKRIRLSLKTKPDEVTYQHLKSESL